MGLIINSHNIFNNFYETMSILSNLWWNVEFKDTIWYIYWVYLQISWVLFFWLLVSILWKKIEY